MKVRILSCAEAELAAAVDYYNEQYPGLGYDLAAEARECLRRIAAYPDAWPHFIETTRRCLLNRFPYAMIYRHTDKEIVVYAFMHLRQNPLKWQKLVKTEDD
ncbi:MAG: hypothetical protein GQF41_1666 [Candidatus Rifleibacterium amylolyticum]|jgi:hypothetical protein|nr:MAG: hypothetical protein GQF41_1666 [Candidatus Rifleibacterium amylolyticum]